MMTDIGGGGGHQPGHLHGLLDISPAGRLWQSLKRTGGQQAHPSSGGHLPKSSSHGVWVLVRVRVRVMVRARLRETQIRVGVQDGLGVGNWGQGSGD